MELVSGQLTVYFENPFWVGFFERVSDGKLSVCKVTFGTKSQQALQLQREEMKALRKQRSREQIDVKKQRVFELKRIKKKEKHKGH